MVCFGIGSEVALISCSTHAAVIQLSWGLCPLIHLSGNNRSLLPSVACDLSQKAWPILHVRHVHNSCVGMKSSPWADPRFAVSNLCCLMLHDCRTNCSCGGNGSVSGEYALLWRVKHLWTGHSSVWKSKLVINTT